MSFKADIQATRSTLATLANTTAEALDATETEIDVTDSSGFPASGTVIIGSEVITYTGNATNTLSGCTRGANGTTAATHLTGAAITVLQNVVAPPIRLKGISIASDGTGAGLISLVSNDGIDLFVGDVPSGDVYTLNLPEDGILFPKGIFLKTNTKVAAFTLFTDKYSAKGLTTVQNG